jgi:hypothetical protein
MAWIMVFRKKARFILRTLGKIMQCSQHDKETARPLSYSLSFPALQLFFREPGRKRVFRGLLPGTRAHA